ncbi:hypothetical protein Acr_00g0053140 [Actinidia rufa]|uniref:CCHC-type domain-containing protein n=1 Tax=Actinidia rufa TaxID=165716 RepID=A0A7J0DL99_9ERIC|nr:hypothetical protein Acr_00g0053140 [Actinidia rufa]
MPPRRGRGRRGAVEPEDRVDRIKRILEGLVQVVHDVHNNNNHDDAPQQPAMPMLGAGAMPQSRKARRFEAGLRWNIKNKVEILRLPTHQEVLHAALIAEESLNEMSQFRENRKKRIGGNKKHWGECRMGSRVCYGCGQEGHQIRDYPMKSKIQGAGTSASASIRQPPTERRNNQPRQGRAFALVPGNTPATTSVVSGILPICG